MAKYALTKSRSISRPLSRGAAITGWALLCAAALPTKAAEVTANVGYMSEYIFRGIPQSDSSVNAGLDLSASGFYLGTWAADVEDGLEVDFYGGYEGSIGDFSYGIGATAYLYTDDFDDDYREINLSLGYGIFSISAAFGEYDNFKGSPIDGGEGFNEKQNYTYIAPRIDYNGFYGLVGIFGDDFDGEYYEVGYGSTLESIGVDWTVSYIHSTKDLLGEDDNSFMLSVTKSFTLFE